ncbi:MAG: hypothetical protein KIT63_02465 [Rhodoferax sp.]|nr:hypothetical protein [Rhodoferax sp.]
MNTSRTIEQLEAHPWPEAPADGTSMVQRCHALRKVPIAKLYPGDIRLLIGQDVGTKHLVPLAIALLEVEPLVEGEFYPGDLLLSLFRLDRVYWSANPDTLNRLLSIARRAKHELSAQAEPLGSDVELLKEVNAFLSQRDA